MTLLDTPAAVVARPKPKRWTKAEYLRDVERGYLARKPIYLYRGELVEMASMGMLHARGVNRLAGWLHDTFRPQYAILGHTPLELPDDTVPQPDRAVCTHEQYARVPHPNAAVLVVEVSDSSVEIDRSFADDYAAAGVPDYWVDNVRDREVEVYRDPRPDAASPTGFRYADHVVHRLGQSVAALARPDAAVSVDWLTDVA